MYSTAKKPTTTNWCRIHSAKNDREIHRTTVCPSKLTKRDLEDLYHRVLDANIDLKKTVNEQRDKIKVLSTKVLRLTATQRSSISKETRECCSTVKAIIDDQNNYIEDLKATIARKNDKIHSQQTRLCSTKQFLSKSNVVSQCTLHSAWTNSPYTTKQQILAGPISITSARSEAKMRKTLSQSELTESGKACVDNKCSTLKEELKQKVENLQLELSQIQSSHSTRIAELESSVERLQAENCRERSNRNISEESRKEAERERRRLREEMSVLEARCCDLKTQLVIEQKKVSELEMRLKSAAISSEVARTIEIHLANRQKLIEPVQVHHMKLSSLAEELPTTPSRSCTNDVETPWSSPQEVKNSDDSGFTDPDVDYKTTSRTNADLMKRIIFLQKELDELKSSAARDCKNSSKSSGFDSNDLEIHTSSQNTPEKSNNNCKIEQCNDSDVNAENTTKKTEINLPNPGLEDIDESTNDTKELPPSRVTFDTHEETAIESPNKTSKPQKETLKEPQTSITSNIEISRINNAVNTATVSKGCKKAKRKKSKQRGSKSHISTAKDENTNACVVENDKGVEQDESVTNEEKDKETQPEIKQKTIQTKSCLKNTLVSARSPKKTDTDVEPEPINDDVPSPPHTYTVVSNEEGTDHEIPLSSDDTEFEISSIAETPRNTKGQSPLSPGERKFSSSCTTSNSTTGDNSCLSEGEVPNRRGRILSIGEKPLPERVVKWNRVNKPTKVNMNEALQSISEELARCRYLLRANPRAEVKRVSSVR